MSAAATPRNCWRVGAPRGLSDVLIEAAQVSTGAVCWFDFALSDSGGAGLLPLAGLGLIAGSCCPHHSSEPYRQSAFRDQIAGGMLPEGIAFDDGVAVLILPGQSPVAFAARTGAGAYSVRRAAGGAVTAPLAAAD